MNNKTNVEEDIKFIEKIENILEANEDIITYKADKDFRCLTSTERTLLENNKKIKEYIRDLEANNYEQNNIINSYIEREQKIIEKLEEAIKRIYIMKNYICVDSDEDEENQEGIRDIEAIETILNYIENSISKEIIEKKIEELKGIADEDNKEEYIKISVLQELLDTENRYKRRLRS